MGKKGTGRCMRRINLLKAHAKAEMKQIPMSPVTVVSIMCSLFFLMVIGVIVSLMRGGSGYQIIDGFKGQSMSASLQPFVVTEDTRIEKSDGTEGSDGGQWTACTHIGKYGPNFDRGLANFISGILRPESALEVGCGIGLYINYIERFSIAENRDHGRFFGIEPEPMINAKVFGQSPYQAMQLAMNILEIDQEVLDDLGVFDVVLSSEVIEHIPCEFHQQFMDALVERTGKFLVFGAARKNQGGLGHICLKQTQDEFVREFQQRQLIHLPKLSQRLRSSCFNGWDKGANTFVMANPRFVKEIGSVEAVEQRYIGLNHVEDLFPVFVEEVYDPIRTKKVKCE